MKLIPNKKYIGKLLVTSRFGFHNQAIPIQSSWGQIFLLPYWRIDKFIGTDYVVFVPLRGEDENTGVESNAEVYN